MGAQQVQRLLGDRGDILAVAFAELAREIPGEQQEVVAALRQRRQPDGDHGETIIEILAKLPLGDRFAEVAVGCGDEAHFHGDGLAPAYPLDLALLHGAQNLGLEERDSCPPLHRGRGTAHCLLEPPILASRAREGLLFGSEELASSKFSGIAAQFTATNRPDAWTVEMEGPGTTSLPVPDSPWIKPWPCWGRRAP